MSIKSHKLLPKARRLGISWMAVGLLGAIGVGLTGISFISEKHIKLEDPETLFIVMSQILFHPLVGGFLLAAILAAIMSTISSQLLVTSSSLTEDFYKLIRGSDKPSSHQKVCFDWTIISFTCCDSCYYDCLASKRYNIKFSW